MSSLAPDSSALGHRLMKAIDLHLSRESGSVRGSAAAVPDSAFEEAELQADALLHPAESDYYRSLKFEKRRRSYLLGRWAAKIAAAEYLGEDDLSAIEVVKGTFQQPLIRYPARQTPDVSISHCKGLAVALAFEAGHIMGIDCENVDARRQEAVRSQLTPLEKDLEVVISDDSVLNGYVLWTLREALSKALRCGLTVPSRILEVAEIEGAGEGAWRARFRNFTQYRACSWAGQTHVLSIALPRKTGMDFDPRRAGLL